jgi:superfamily II DNA or RNA helicase
LRITSYEVRTVPLRFLWAARGTGVPAKVANFAIDLPDAYMAIQISGTYGSRQEEAQ